MAMQDTPAADDWSALLRCSVHLWRPNPAHNLPGKPGSNQVAQITQSQKTRTVQTYQSSGCCHRHSVCQSTAIFCDCEPLNILGPLTVSRVCTTQFRGSLSSHRFSPTETGFWRSTIVEAETVEPGITSGALPEPSEDVDSSLTL